MSAGVIDDEMLAVTKHVSVRRIINIKSALIQFSDFAKFKSFKLVNNIIWPTTNLAVVSSQLFNYEGLVSSWNRNFFLVSLETWIDLKRYSPDLVSIRCSTKRCIGKCFHASNANHHQPWTNAYSTDRRTGWHRKIHINRQFDSSSVARCQNQTSHTNFLGRIEWWIRGSAGIAIGRNYFNDGWWVWNDNQVSLFVYITKIFDFLIHISCSARWQTSPRSIWSIGRDWWEIARSDDWLFHNRFRTVGKIGNGKYNLHNVG